MSGLKLPVMVKEADETDEPMAPTPRGVHRVPGNLSHVGIDVADNGGVTIRVEHRTKGKGEFAAPSKSQTHVFASYAEADSFIDKLFGYKD